MEEQHPAVVHDAAAGQFEMRENGQLAFLAYTMAGNRIRLVHTEVPPELQGRGYADRLVRAALEHARREGLAVVPSCPFVRAYIERHPEYAPLVATSG
ncbi:MAG TPA: GNAT family N-acetyltransferase [Gemmatimonadaceae bacterium]|nr:GNAT family N-acetyltransferase [Gemmatimonadaceae bacterium]